MTRALAVIAALGLAANIAALTAHAVERVHVDLSKNEWRLSQ